MGKYQRTKGHSWERDLAIMLRPIFPHAKRHLENQAVEANGYDLDCTGIFRFQAKCMAKVPNIPQVFSEFKTGSDSIHAVAFKVTNKGAYMAFKMEDALKLIAAFDAQNKNGTI